YPGRDPPRRAAGDPGAGPGGALELRANRRPAATGMASRGPLLARLHRPHRELHAAARGPGEPRPGGAVGLAPGEARARRSASLRDASLKHAEAHLVGRAFAPEHVARRERLASDHRLLLSRVVVPAGDANDAAGGSEDGLLQRVEVLPVEVP